MAQFEWAKRTAESIIERTPLLYENYNGKWSYDYGVVLKGFERLWNLTGEERYLQFIQENMDYFIRDDGSIVGYRQEEHNIDHINNGKMLICLYKATRQKKYRDAAALLREQLRTHPRTSEGAFWHKRIYPHQIWLDGLYMGAPFYLEFLLTFEHDSDIDDVTRQFIICERHTKDKKTGLLYHAWDEKHVQPWCDEVTGQSLNFWGRSMGWFVMALVDVLEYLPQNHQDYAELSRILNDAMVALQSFQDENSGVWYQVLDAGNRKGNYLEASASSMITYAIAKGIRLGLLHAGWKETLNRAFKGLLEEFVMESKKGLLNLNKNCQVAGLGGSEVRDGTYAYYISEPIITNDLKGLGAFLLACAEYEDLIHE